jgi:hypothetical protein
MDAWIPRKETALYAAVVRTQNRMSCLLLASSADARVSISFDRVCLTDGTTMVEITLWSIFKS